jgi:hypothetical protein
MSNEDLWLLRSLMDAAGGGGIDFRVDDAWRGVDDLTDGVLIRRDPNPNTRGALEILDLGRSESGVAEILSSAVGGGLIVCEWDLAALGEPGRAAIEGAEWLCFVGARENALLERADLVLPGSIHVEREGTFTNWAGRVQRFWPAVPPYERSRPAWEILAAIRSGLGRGEALLDAAAAFRELAAAVPAFHGLGYVAIGDQGMWLRGWEKDAMPPVGLRPRPGMRAQQTF